jgi:thiopeptide-type bacteriocin biosynthesis protein
MVQRKFLPGDKWLYFKIYTGPKTADSILSQVILPLTKELNTRELITKWFFIRYNDPKYHLRFRVYLKNQNCLGDVMNLFNQFIKPWLNNHYIHKVQIETYNRELERYGLKTIDLAEELFHFDSISISKLIDSINGEEAETNRWLFSVYAINQLLTDFQYSVEEKQKLLFTLKENFGREFGMNKNLKFQLDKKFRNERPIINKLMKGADEYNFIYQIVNERSIHTKKIICEIKSILIAEEGNDKVNNVLGSYLHMLCNRLFKSKQRLHELVIYDFMERYYTSEIAKAKYSKSKA